MSLGGGYSTSMNAAVDAAVDKVCLCRIICTVACLNQSCCVQQAVYRIWRGVNFGGLANLNKSRQYKIMTILVTVHACLYLYMYVLQLH